MRAWAGSYTPQGRSQWAWTTRVGLRKASSMGSPPSREPSSETYRRGRKWVPGAAAGLPVALAIVLAFLRWKPFRVEVEGASMVPTLLPGDWALGVEAHTLKRGDVVVVEHPGRPGYEMVKRLTA